MRRAGAPRVAALLAGLWAGLLLCIAAIAAPSAFAVLAPADAGRFVGRMFAQEALPEPGRRVVLLLIERAAQRSASRSRGASLAVQRRLMLLLGTLFCTVAGYFALQPMMAAARAGQGPLSFGALHAHLGRLLRR